MVAGVENGFRCSACKRSASSSEVLAEEAWQSGPGVQGPDGSFTNLGFCLILYRPQTGGPRELHNCEHLDNSEKNKQRDS